MKLAFLAILLLFGSCTPSRGDLAFDAQVCVYLVMKPQKFWCPIAGLCGPVALPGLWTVELVGETHASIARYQASLAESCYLKGFFSDK